MFNKMKTVFVKLKNDNKSLKYTPWVKLRISNNINLDVYVTTMKIISNN